jgi:hypothetical protein
MMRRDDSFRPAEVNVSEFTNGGFAPCEGAHWWWEKETGKIQFFGGSDEKPVALCVTAPGSDKAVIIQLSIEDARWAAAKMLEIAEHAERYPRPEVQP